MIWQFGERAANARIEKVASRSPSARSAMTRLKALLRAAPALRAAVMPASVFESGSEANGDDGRDARVTTDGE